MFGFIALDWFLYRYHTGHQNAEGQSGTQNAHPNPNRLQLENS